MKLAYAKSSDLIKLHVELLSLPFLQPKIRENGEREAVFILCGDSDNIILDVLDDLTPEQITEIEQVVNNHYPDPTISAFPNPAAVNEIVIVTAILPDGAPDTEVTFQLEGGTAYVEPIINGQASHAYAFAQPGTYKIIVSSTHCGSATVEVTVA